MALTEEVSLDDLIIEDSDRGNTRHALSGITSVSAMMGPYRLCYEIASGGVATVYLARLEPTPGFERVVAVKRLHQGLANERSFVEMFFDEAKVASRIDHPNVCTVTDFGVFDGRPYLVMQYLVGEPLSRVLSVLRKKKEARADPRHTHVVTRIVADLCEGLHAAHELKDEFGQALNVVHRDATPHNLFVLYDGSVRVADFGIAQFERRAHRTRAGLVKGKLSYMAPEQSAGRPLDRRADIWAMGVVLWELLTGKRLFLRETDEEIVKAISVEPIPRPRNIDPNVPEELEEIVMKALRRHPDDRFRTCREMASALVERLTVWSDPVSAPVVGAWLSHLFPGGEEYSRELIAAARRVGHEVVATPSKPPDPTSAEREITPRDVVVDLRKEVPIQNVPPPVVHTQRKAPGWVVVAGLLAAAAIGAVGYRFIDADGIRRGASMDTIAAAAPFERSIMAASDSAPEATERAFEATTTIESIQTTPEPSKIEPASGLSQDDRASAARPSSTSPSARRITRPRARSEEDFVATADVPSRIGTGEAYVATPGISANVYGQGRLLGRTPLRVRLPVGPHTLMVSRDRNSPRVPVRVTVRPGSVAMVDVGDLPEAQP